jgi:hypothetical protein
LEQEIQSLKLRLGIVQRLQVLVDLPSGFDDPVADLRELRVDIIQDGFGIRRSRLRLGYRLLLVCAVGRHAHTLGHFLHIPDATLREAEPQRSEVEHPHAGIVAVLLAILTGLWRLATTRRGAIWRWLLDLAVREVEADPEDGIAVSSRCWIVHDNRAPTGGTHLLSL